MFNLLPTVTVSIKVVSGTVTDSYGDTQMIYSEHSVSECLIAPYRTSEMKTPFELHDESLVKLHIPTAFTSNLKNATFTYAGRNFKVLGDSLPLPYSPLQWNRNVIGEELLNHE